MLVSIVAGAAFGAAFLITGLFRRYAVAHKRLDVPNARSSHTVATPRGGGTAIVIVTIASLLVLGLCEAVPWPTVVAFAGAGLVVALVGFLDDFGNTAPGWRLGGHFVAAGWMLRWLGGVPPVFAFDAAAQTGFVGQLLALLFLVWVINLTNFMDGIDGIAAVETITVCASGWLLYELAVPRTGSSLILIALGSATIGFLVWNWPPARVFMGDTGSGFLGLFLGGLALQAGWLSSKLFWAWVVLLGVFVVDATFTLARRVGRRVTFYEAHRSHGYQHAAQKYGHLHVTLTVLAINVLWLLPIALMVARGSLGGIVAVLIAYFPLTVVAIVFDAGREPVRVQ